MWRTYRRDPDRTPAKIESEHTGKRGRPRKVYVYWTPPPLFRRPKRRTHVSLADIIRRGGQPTYWTNERLGELLLHVFCLNRLRGIPSGRVLKDICQVLVDFKQFAPAQARGRKVD